MGVWELECVSGGSPADGTRPSSSRAEVRKHAEDAEGRMVAAGAGEGGGLTARRTRQRQSECTADWRPPAGGNSPSSSAFMESMVRSYLAAHAMTWSALNVALNKRNFC